MSTEIYNLPNGSKIIGNIMPDMERVSFSKEMIRFNTESIYQFMVYDFEAKMKQKPGEIEKEMLRQLAFQKSGEQFQQTLNDCPLVTQLEQILTDTSLRKKDIERLLRGVEIKIGHIASFFYRAEELGYQFSSFRFEGKPKDVPDEDLPSFIHCNDSEVTRVGGSGDLSDGKLRQLVDQQKVLVTHIASKGSHWHCLLQTFAGLKGKESGEQGSRSHIHYISDITTGLTYDQIVAMVKSGNYPAAKIHLPLLDGDYAEEDSSEID